MCHTAENFILDIEHRDKYAKNKTYILKLWTEKMCQPYSLKKWKWECVRVNVRECAQY